MSVMKIRDENGVFQPVRTIRGEKGEDGSTPVKGADYWTEEDRAAIIAELKASLTPETWTFTLADGSTVTRKVVTA